MTADSRFERDLTAVLEDLYLGPAPDYRYEVLTVATHRRQRPSWTFPGRWLPMADITSNRQGLAARAPLRALGVALVVIALVVAALVVVGSARRTSVPLPAPFGLAGNGQIVFGFGGDIYSIDPVTRASTFVTHGAPNDQHPIFSPDGTRVAFVRASSAGSGDDIIVAAPDGAGERVITAAPIPGGPRGLAWAPDSRSLLSTAPDGSGLWLFDAASAAAPRVIPTDVSPYLEPFRPPDGKQILASRGDANGRQLVVLDLVTGAQTVLATGGGAYDYVSARWSPDGTKVVFNDRLPDEVSQRLFEIGADGSGLRQLTNEPGAWLNFDPVWSPDGSRIAFARHEDAGVWTVRPVGIYDVASGSVRAVGPVPSEVRAQHPTSGDAYVEDGEAFQLAWSPDGTALLALANGASGHPVLINVADGTWTVIDAEAESNGTAQAWQRKAP